MMLYRILVSAVPLTVLFTLYAGMFPAAAAASPIQATYVWNTAIINDSPEELLSFAQDHQINTIYLQIDPELSTSVYKAFIGNASIHGIQVHALDGAPDWATKAGKKKIERLLKWLGSYQNNASPEEKFSGIHVDIEPYLLPEWKSGYNALIKQWQSNTEYLVREAHRRKLPVSAAIPFWFDEYHIPGSAKTLSSWMIERFDSITVMAYRDTAGEIIQIAEQELIEAGIAGKPVVLAVETNPTEEPQYITFFEEGLEYMLEQLAEVRERAAAYDAFAGFAIHDYSGWKAMSGR